MRGVVARKWRWLALAITVSPALVETPIGVLLVKVALIKHIPILYTPLAVCIKVIKHTVYWVIFFRPCSPSFFNFSR